MNYNKERTKASKESPAQIVDTLLQRTAIGLFLLAIAYTMSAAMYVINNQDIVNLMDRLQLVPSILVLLIVFPAFVKFAKLRYRRKSECSEADGYLVEMFRRASAMAFGLTFVFLIVLELVTEKYLTGLPTPFFINATLAFSLGVLSVGFFRLARGDGDDESDDDFDAEPAP